MTTTNDEQDHGASLRSQQAGSSEETGAVPTNWSPLPWALSHLGPQHIEAANGQIAAVVFPDDGPVRDANAAFIVRACNNHDALLALAQHTLGMLRACRDQAPKEWDALVATAPGSWLPATWDDLKAALAKAEGK